MLYFKIQATRNITVRKGFVCHGFIVQTIGEQGGGVRGGSTPSEFFLWPPSKIQNDPHPLRNGFWPPIRFWASDVCFFRKDVKKFAQKKKFSPPYAGTSSWPKRAKTAIKFLAWDPPGPLCFNFLWPSSSKKIFWPPSRNDDLAHLWCKQREIHQENESWQTPRGCCGWIVVGKVFGCCRSVRSTCCWNQSLCSSAKLGAFPMKSYCV